MKLEPVYLLAPLPEKPKGVSRRALLLFGAASAAAGFAVGWSTFHKAHAPDNERLTWALSLVDAPIERLLAEADALLLVAAVTGDSRLESTLLRMAGSARSLAPAEEEELLDKLRTVSGEYPRLAHALETRRR